MISKQDVIDSITHETNVIKFLAGKLTDENLEYRPTENQRSTLELLQYLTYCASVPAFFALKGHWDDAPEFSEKAKKVTLENFSSAMDQQLETVIKILKSETDESLASKEASTPWGVKLSAGAALMNMCVKFMAAYRMQLFLYLKSQGQSNLSTVECWVGMDAAGALV